ncbi:hypothetical protein [Pedobacter africanus]|uniref:Uncharacterized protein n=1 Tax=Pedobacter africanus TaxID=151894 RepID=A0A1W2BR46_9SPHI|nr:hypothetical protein [Pedobacter africanus]SMC75485.1 hypothetical protein SAMN04488524_2577 [Pedobacter africanus]
MIRLRITEVNFTTKENWLFRLVDDEKNEYYIMNQLFYEAQNLKSPITKRELDQYDKGYIIKALIKQFDNKNVVIEIL